MQKQKVAIDVSWDLVEWHLEGMFGSVEKGLDKQDKPTLRVSFLRRQAAAQQSEVLTVFFSWILPKQVMNAVDMKLTADRELTLEWVASVSNDMIADAALSLVMGIESSKASVKRKSSFCLFFLAWSWCLTAQTLLNSHHETTSPFSPPPPRCRGIDLRSRLG